MTGDIDGLIVLFEGKIELLLPKSILPEDLKNSCRETFPNASANSSYPLSSTSLSSCAAGPVALASWTQQHWQPVNETSKHITSDTKHMGQDTVEPPACRNKDPTPLLQRARRRHTVAY